MEKPAPISGIDDLDTARVMLWQSDRAVHAPATAIGFNGILTQSTNPTPTTEGQIQWDTDDNAIVVGDGAATRIFPAYPASMGRGDLIVGTANARQAARLALGAAGQVVKSDGTDLVFGAPSPVRMTAQATTSGTAFNFTSIPTGVRRISVMLSGVSLSGTNNLLVQIGDSGGLETTGYTSTSALYLTAPSIAFVNSTAGFIITAAAAARVITGSLVLENIDGNEWIVASGNFQPTTTTGFVTAAGSKTLSATLDRVTLLATGADTFDLGLVNVLYQ